MAPRNPLAPLLARSPFLIIDGALATELERRGHDLTSHLWSAKVLIEQPDAIQQVHRDYFAAGADIAITASYQATAAGLAQIGLDAAASAALIAKSVALARRARDEAAAAQASARPLLVAGSVGPYGAFLADGAEYRGDYTLPRAEMMAFHRARVRALVGAGADLLACETMPSLAEVDALVALLRAEEPGAVCWVAVTLRDAGHMADGSSLEALGAVVEGAEQVVAVGVNCVARELVRPALEALARATSKPLLAYPNSGEVWDGQRKTWQGERAAEETSSADLLGSWRGAGALLVGGCCRTGPKDIEAMKSLRDASLS